MKRISILPLLLLPVIGCVLLYIQPAFAAQKGLTRAQSVDVFSGNENYAVVIGVNKYDEIGNLNYAVEDAEKLTKFFQEQGYTVKTLTNYGATKNRIIKNLRNIAAVAGNPGGQHSNVVFAFSGHGFRHQGQNYLATPETDPANISATALSLKDVSDILAEAEVRQRVLFIDACRNDPSKSAAGKSRTFTADKSAEGLAILYSTRADKLSWEDNKLQQGVFSHFLIKGLKGAAAAEDGYVSFDRLRRYVSTSVKKYVIKQFDEVQIPYIGGERTGQFVLASGPRAKKVVTPMAQATFISSPPLDKKKGSLTVKVDPSSARVRIMNVRPKYQAGMQLALNENYDILVSQPGYQSWRQSVRLDQNAKHISVTLKKSQVPQKFSVTTRRKTKWFEPEMLVVPAGSFRMGDVSGGGGTNEQPTHLVDVKAFEIGKFEVTFAQYNVFTEAAGRHSLSDQGWGKGSRPVINVNWHDANSYIAWLNKNTEGGYRLPTEAEWEYAARGGSKGAFSWGNSIGSNKANCKGCGSQWDNLSTAPIGRFGPIGYGLHDMHGNVWEWTCSEYTERYSGQEQQCASEGETGLRTLRGGSWSSDVRSIRSASRVKIVAEFHDSDTGFRLVRAIIP